MSLKKVVQCLTEVKGCRQPLYFYNVVRCFVGSRFHRHIRYEKGSTRPLPQVIDPKLLTAGKPASASVMLGDMSQVRKFEWDMEALNVKGFLRFQKPYDPPSNVAENVMDVCRSVLKTSEDGPQLMRRELRDPREKFELLNQTFEEFQHAVPNSMLYMMNTVGDVVNFYCTPVNINTPYEELIRSKDLPPNLHIQKEPHRFHPDTDTMFNGESAFPKSSNIVTGLRAKKKYRGFEAKMTWP